MTKPSHKLRYSCYSLALHKQLCWKLISNTFDSYPFTHKAWRNIYHMLQDLKD